MDYFIAADKRTLVAVSQTGEFAVTLKRHWFSKGLTRTQAALAFVEFLSGAEFDQEQKSWRKLRRTFNRHPEVAGVLMNDPPLQDPIAHKRFFSLDSASVEMWLREVFGEYRQHLPPFVAALQQDWQTWTGERWVHAQIPRPARAQAKAAQSTHALISETVEKKAEAKAQALQIEATAKLEEMVQQAKQAVWADQAQAGLASPVWSNSAQALSSSGVAARINPLYDPRV
jgi:hypothetical protein